MLQWLQQRGQVCPRGGVLAPPCKHLFSKGLQSGACQGHIRGRGVPRAPRVRLALNTPGCHRYTHWPENSRKGQRSQGRWGKGEAWLDFEGPGAQKVPEAVINPYHKVAVQSEARAGRGPAVPVQDPCLPLLLASEHPPKLCHKAWDSAPDSETLHPGTQLG